MLTTSKRKARRKTKSRAAKICGKLGVEFSEHPPLADVAVGCFVVNPVTLKSLGKTIKLSPEAVLNCNMARTTARFMQDVAAPSPKPTSAPS